MNNNCSFHLRRPHSHELSISNTSCLLKYQSSVDLGFECKFLAMWPTLFSSMANAEHAPAMASPVRTDEQIVPRNRWVPIGKSNCYLNEEKSQPNPIFKIAVDILKQTNFHQKLLPSVSYKFPQLDEQWFNLTQDTLRDALQITPVDNNRAFSSPPTPDTLVEFVNKLGYPKEVIHLSNVTTNDMFQPWRALTTIINLRQKEVGTTYSGEEESNSYPYPSYRVYTKMIIFPLQQQHNFHPRPDSPLHLPTEEPVLGHLKFSAKGSKREKSKPAPAKPKEKKRKPVSESSEAQPLAKRAKAGKVVKKRTVKSSKQLVDEFVDEGVPAAKPSLEDTEEAILQKVLEESLTDAYPTQRGEEQAAQVFSYNLQPKEEGSRLNNTNLETFLKFHLKPAGREDSYHLICRLIIWQEIRSDEENAFIWYKWTKMKAGWIIPRYITRDEGQAGPNPDDLLKSPRYQLLVVLELDQTLNLGVEITDPSSQPQPSIWIRVLAAAGIP
ncbi:hypothetical protein Tco_0011311 [Tanacetum coccineum]